MAIALIDYGAGNLRSAAKALAVAGADDVRVTADPETVRRADRIVLPGVGAFGACATALRAIPGMEEALTETVRGKGRPFLGICVGMQLLAEEGEEFGAHRGLGWLKGRVVRLRAPGLRIPHIGWNEVEPVRDGLVRRGYAYFVHSYAMRLSDGKDILATSDYGEAFTAAVQQGTALGVQFHPEKSDRYGLDLLHRFLAWKP